MNDRDKVIFIFRGLANNGLIYKCKRNDAGKFIITRCTIDDPDLRDQVDTIHRLLSPAVAAAALMPPKTPKLQKPSRGPKPSPNASKNPFPKNNKPASVAKANLRFPKAGRGR